MRRIGGWVVFCGVLVCAACNGFPDPVPIEEAEKKPEKYPSYNMDAAPTVITVERQRWVVLPGALAQVPPSMLQPIGSGGGGTLFSIVGDQAPYDALYARLPDGKLRVVAEIHD